ncbi:MAG: hypothetical protein ACE5GW_11320, partial [Planctomycetota bacterium]
VDPDLVFMTTQLKGKETKAAPPNRRPTPARRPRPGSVESRKKDARELRKAAEELKKLGKSKEAQKVLETLEKGSRKQR